MIAHPLFLVLKEIIIIIIIIPEILFDTEYIAFSVFPFIFRFFRYKKICGQNYSHYSHFFPCIKNATRITTNGGINEYIKC